MGPATWADHRAFAMTSQILAASSFLVLLAGCARNDALSSLEVSPPSATSTAMPSESRPLAALSSAVAWLNSPPLDATRLRGKVVLLQFWTYTCINWRRTMPYVRAWSEKYGSSGLVVIGVHSPEFDFEKVLANVEQGVRDTNVRFPVAVDSEHTIWNAFDNEYWPALYFFDAKGQLRHHQFGEGDYERSETVIQGLLSEAGATGAPSGWVSGAGSGAELAANWADLGSPEHYLDSEGTPGRIHYRFHARDLHLVMGPLQSGASARFRVWLDGQAPGRAHGDDVDAEGYGTVKAPRMYQLIRQSSPIVDRTFEIEFIDAAVRAYSFTFG
jgi:thiol-disulfide isomerase/thioredoxin